LGCFPTGGDACLTALAASPPPPSEPAGRDLLQASYDCKAAKGIGNVKDACKLLCACAAGLNSKLKPRESFCLNQCEKCKSAAAAQDCSKNSALPSACNEGRNGEGGKEVDQCITTFLRASAGRH
jgi:hypothetical protein